MDLLFLSRRIYLGDGSHELPLNGGIIVDTGGIIRRGKRKGSISQPFAHYKVEKILIYILIGRCLC